MSWEDLVRDLVGNVGISGKIANDARNANLTQQQMGVQTRMMEAQLSGLERAQMMQQRYDARVAEYLKNPTAEELQRIAAEFPEKAQELKGAWQVKDNAVRTADLRFFGSARAAIQNKQLDSAVRIFTQRRDAERAAGRDTSDLDYAIAALSSKDPAKVKEIDATLLAQIAAGSDPEKFGSTFKDVGGEVQNDFTLAPGARRFRADGSLVAEAPFAPRPVTVSEGQTVVEYQPGGGGQASGGAGGGSPRGVRNNNLGNLRDGPFARSQPGYTGRDDSGFAIFETPEAGNAAQERLLTNNYLSKGYDTPLSIVNRYAPPSENSAASINNYAAYIARKLGIGPNDPVPPGQVGVLAQAMREFENGQTGGGGPRVIAQGAPKPGYRILTPQENQQYGLNPSIRYQQAPDGQITAIGGQDTKARQGRAVPDSTAKRVEGAVAIRDALEGALSTFRDDYAGNTLTGGLENTLQGYFGTGTPGQRDWWANFRQNDNQIRNDLFGSALTATEKAAYEATTISERMAPAEIRRNLQRRAAIIKRALARQQNFLKKNGYDAEAVDALYGADPLASEQAARGSRQNPIPVRSRQEALRYKGQWIKTPDGRVGRVR